MHLFIHLQMDKTLGRKSLSARLSVCPGQHPATEANEDAIPEGPLTTLL